MRGDLRAIEIRAEPIPDGAGGEEPGHIARVWIEGEDGQDVLGLTLSMRDSTPAPVEEFKRFVDFWLSVWEIE